MRQQYEAVTERDRTINQLKSELPIARSKLQDLSNAETMAKHLREEVGVARVQFVSMESAAQKAVADVKSDCERREEHLQAKLEVDVQSTMEMEAQSHQHAIALQKNKIIVQSTEIAEQKPGIAENSEKQRRLFNDLQALKSEMQENQSLREELLESKTDLRRLRADFDPLPKNSPTMKLIGTQGHISHRQRNYTQISSFPSGNVEAR